MRAHGFTLPELIIVIVLLGIVGALGGIFIRGPVDAYVEVPSVDDSSTKQQIRVAPGHSEEVQRVHVEEEDRLAFRVGVNILTLALIGLGVYLVWRNFFQ